MKPIQIVIFLTVLTSLALSACGAGKPEPTPTLTVGQIETSAVSTFAAGLTQTAFYKPTATLTPSPQPTNTLSATFPVSTLPGLLASPTTAAVTSCNNLVYVADVTIPDNTQMNPGQSFTKTWRVQNSGSCAWGADYKFSLVGGDAMGAQAITLGQSIAPGATYEISVPMTAPATAGTVTGNWRMSDAAGSFFGDAVYVTIVVGGAGGGSPTATTGAPTATSTP
jgi:uncharacterized protein affecting Mg2+/Co2+ transport